MIATRYQINAATDVTDSLALDLATVASKSNCGFCIDADSIPFSDAARNLSVSSGRSALDHALYDGEDFELLLCVSKSVAQQILRDDDLKEHLTRIGELTQSAEFRMLKPDQADATVLEIRGFEH